MYHNREDVEPELAMRFKSWVHSWAKREVRRNEGNPVPRIVNELRPKVHLSASSNFERSRAEGGGYNAMHGG